jgi:hypothetical protein
MIEAKLPFLWLNEIDEVAGSPDGGVILDRNHEGGGPAVFLRGAYAAAPDLLEACKSLLTWAIVHTSSDNPQVVINAIMDIRNAVLVLERTDYDPQIRMEGLDEIEAEARDAIAKAEGTN